MLDLRPDYRRYFPALAVGAYVAVAILVLPSFAPATGTTAANAAAKADRLHVASAAPACAEQNWPNIDATCLKGAKAKSPVRQVTTDRRTN